MRYNLCGSYLAFKPVRGETVIVNIVLHEPQIPENTGNIARLCAVAACQLHLIRPLGFFLDDKHLKRAGLDYWDKLDITVHDNWNAFTNTCKPKRLFFVETDGSRLYTEVSYKPDDYLVFGSETAGLPSVLLKDNPNNHISLPMINPRSLNLANTVAITLYEAWRQLGFTQL